MGEAATNGDSAPHTNGIVTDVVVNENTSPNKVPSSITRVYNVPVVKDTVQYADSVIRSLPLAGAAYTTAEAIATSVYKRAGEPLQERLQPQIQQLDGLANKGLDYVQGKAPYIFDTKTDELVASARKPADQAYTTAKSYQSTAYTTAKSYQDLVQNRLHETLLNSQKTLAALQEKLQGAIAVVPKSTDEANKLASQLYENLESIKEALLKQSHDLSADVSKAVHPYLEKLQKGANDVKAELGKKDVPIQAKAQHIIAITKEISSESLHDAIETLRSVINANQKKVDGAEGSVKENGKKAEEFVKDHTPGDVSYAEAAKE